MSCSRTRARSRRSADSSTPAVSRCAGEVAERSRVELGDQRLSTRRGCRSAVELLERVTQASAFEARRRIVLGSATRARAGLTGEPIEAAFPSSRRRWPRVRWARMPRARSSANSTAPARSPTRPRSRPPSRHSSPRRPAAATAPRYAAPPMSCACRRRRGPRSSIKTAANPTTSGRCDVAGSASVGPATDSSRSPAISCPRSPRNSPGSSTRTSHHAPGLGFHTDEERASFAESGERRTADQQRHDVLAAVIDTAARSGEHPTIGGAAPTVLVSVRASDLAAGRGVAHADGVEVPISLRAARHMICTGGTQTVTFDQHGRIIALGSPERCFTPHQRRAITLRDGGCLIPGCSVPAAWCEIHHVTPDAHGGPTHPDNGVLLCWFHHRTIDTSGWGIRMHRGVPHIRPPAWLDPGGTWRPTTKSPTRLADQRRPALGSNRNGAGGTRARLDGAGGVIRDPRSRARRVTVRGARSGSQAADRRTTRNPAGRPDRAPRRRPGAARTPRRARPARSAGAAAVARASRRRWATG